jgi:hypothetical protein
VASQGKGLGCAQLYGQSHELKKDNVEAIGLSVSLSLLLQLRVLRFGLFQDWYVGIGVFPEGEETFVGGECPDAGGVGIGSLFTPRPTRFKRF